ncbi:hypothetical protein PgNI_10398 [Pyricularia grisea]|uniref:Uncharacterized protein n=1 Tax=Pyricularia grisea TaxID=148305 RepID=A0A6P8AXT6_PYRGI|nr:hypothetical protein PgNI_10398 [Pyricularia grisea]TLD07096.1 hypothetical protein PgNI_10398 [Pyricularia grisea]
MAAKPLPPAPSTVGSHPSVSAMFTRMGAKRRPRNLTAKR